MRGDDRVLSHAEVVALIERQTLVFYDDGESRFSVGGAYSYTYAGSGTAFGQYEIDPDGMVCIAYRNGFERCDRYVQNGARIVMLTQKGERFPLRPLTDD
ncbi:hypothetical protein [Roseobacter fucihabitans]|nr:hypothetical protein [Roseobacter litoralis]